MPTLRAALGRDTLSFGEVASLKANPPGHVTNIPQRQIDSLSLGGGGGYKHPNAQTWKQSIGTAIQRNGEGGRDWAKKRDQEREKEANKTASQRKAEVNDDGAAEGSALASERSSIILLVSPSTSP